MFAIAHAVSFAFKGTVNANLKFDTNVLRKHLLECLENNLMTEFPLTKNNMSIGKKKKEKKNCKLLLL